MASKGRTFVLQIGDGATSEAFTTIGQFRSNSITINNEIVDITTKSDAQVRKLLESAGVKTRSMNGSGVANYGDTQYEALKTHALNDTHNNYKLLDTDSGKYYQGSFAVANFEESGEYNGEVAFSCSFESAGTITYA